MDEHTKHPHRLTGRRTRDHATSTSGRSASSASRLIVITVLSIGLLIGVFRYFQSRDDRERRRSRSGEDLPEPAALQNEPTRSEADSRD